MKKPYCCDASRHMYEQYCTNQQNGYGNFLLYIGAYRHVVTVLEIFSVDFSNDFYQH
jgi:hypothetical protein